MLLNRKIGQADQRFGDRSMQIASDLRLVPG